MVVRGQFPQKVQKQLSLLGQRLPHRVSAALQVPEFRACQGPLPEAKGDGSWPCKQPRRSCAGKWRRFGRKSADCAASEKVKGREMGSSLRHTT